jgi:hypothetical protein
MQQAKLFTGPGCATLHGAHGEAKSLCRFSYASPLDIQHLNDSSKDGGQTRYQATHSVLTF